MINFKPLKRLLIEKDITWEMLSKETGVSKETLHRIKTGKNVKLETLKKILDYFECDLCDILEYEDIHD